MTLLARLYILVVLAIAPAFALLSYHHWTDRVARERAAEAQALAFSRLLSYEIDRVFEGVRAQLSAVANAPVVQSFRDPECGEYLERLELTNPATTTFSVYDTSGARRCSDAGPNIVDRPFFGLALETDEPVVGNYTIGRTSALPVLPFAVRITKKGEVVGVIVTTLRLDWFGKHLIARTSAFPPRTSITVTDATETILVHLPDRDREGTNLNTYRHLSGFRREGTLRSEGASDGVERLVGYTSRSGPGGTFLVAVGIPLEIALRGSREAWTRSTLLLSIVAALAFAAAHFGGRAFILRPIDALLQGAERWRRGDMRARVAFSSPTTELGQLAFAFNALAAELEQSLKHKDVLLRELPHRVMNNLQTIASLFQMQARSVSNPKRDSISIAP